VARFDCPHCNKALGGDAPQGGFKVRLGITLIDPDTGRVHGPCTHCKRDVTIATGAEPAKAFSKPTARPGIPIPRP
jgi:hypothetical protein